MIEYLLVLLAYGSIAAAIVIFLRGATDCNQDCNQGRNCDCTDDEFTFK